MMGLADNGATKRKVEPPPNTIPLEQVGVNLVASDVVAFKRVLGAQATPDRLGSVERSAREKTAHSIPAVAADAGGAGIGGGLFPGLRTLLESPRLPQA
jgi:hypothetical protein